MNTEDLIARASSLTTGCFRLIFERYTRPVINIFCMVNRRDLAEELAQGTFLRAYEDLSALSVRAKIKLSVWLFGISLETSSRAVIRASEQRTSR